MTKEECLSWFQQEEMIKAPYTFYFYICKDGKIVGNCRDGCCDMEYNSFEEFWTEYQNEKLEKV